jgi:hypothetical protein
MSRLPRRRLRFAVLLAVLVGSAFVAGCDGTAASPSGSAGGSPTNPLESFERWPAGVPSSVTALAAADAEIARAGQDLQTAAQEEDPEGLMAAADGLAALAEGNIRNAQQVAAYAGTRAAGEAALAAMTALRDAARHMADSVRAGDAAGVEAASHELSAAIRLYGEARGPISELVPEALRQQKALVR